MSEEALRRAIWSEPLTASERSIIESKIRQFEGHELAKWLRFLLAVYDGEHAGD